MNTRMVEQNKLGESDALESLRTRGMAADGFVEGYEARDAIMQAARVVREMRSEAGLTQGRTRCTCWNVAARNQSIGDWAWQAGAKRRNNRPIGTSL